MNVKKIKERVNMSPLRACKDPDHWKNIIIGIQCAKPKVPKQPNL